LPLKATEPPRKNNQKERKKKSEKNLRCSVGRKQKTGEPGGKKKGQGEDNAYLSAWRKKSDPVRDRILREKFRRGKGGGKPAS